MTEMTDKDSSTKKEKNAKIIKISLLVALIILLVAACVIILPYVKRITSMNQTELNEFLSKFDSALRKLGPLRYIFMILLQILQMILAPIPGGPVAVMMGFMFGTFWGTVLTILSTALGTALIIGCVKLFGMSFVNKFINSKEFEKLKFLHNSAKRDTLLFLLFLIPGTPKDLITFFAPFTGAKPKNIIVLASLARIPSIFLMVYLGDAVSEGNIVKSVIILTVAAVIGIVGIIFKDKVMPEHTESRIVKGKDTFIFDLDGTLLNTLTDLTNATNYALEKQGAAPRTEDQVRKAVGNGIGKLIERSLPNGKKNPDYEAVLSNFKEYYKEHCLDNTKPYDGIKEMLNYLRENGYKTAIVSNKADFAVKELCADIFPEVTVAIGESDGVRRKPAPDSVITALKELGSSKEKAVYIGDSDVDIQTAKNAGMGCISVTWGFRSEAFLNANGASVLVNSPHEIIDAIEKEKNRK
jgi:phosphoglycolate phosphatase